MNEATMQKLAELPRWEKPLPSEWRFVCPVCGGDEGWLERNPKLNLIGCFTRCHPVDICYHAGINLSDLFPQGNYLARELFVGLVKTAIQDGIRISGEDRHQYLQFTKMALAHSKTR